MIGNTCERMVWNSNAHFFRIANNNIRYTSSSSGTALFILNVKNSSVEVNKIENNSINVSGSGSFTTHNGINLANINASNAFINVLNNAVSYSGSSSPTGNGIIVSSAATYNLFAAYNHVSTSFDNEFVNIALGLNTQASLTIPSTGIPTGATILDCGHPGKDYIDHDLSRNDPGCYGGSFNYTNYTTTAAPVIFHVETPRTVLQGSTLNVTSEGFDR